MLKKKFKLIKLYWALFLIKGFSHSKTKKILIKYNINCNFIFLDKEKLFSYSQVTNFIKHENNFLKKYFKLKIKKYNKGFYKKIKKYLNWKKRKWSVIGHYKWYRLKKKLPLNGQRTKTNSRTNRRILK